MAKTAARNANNLTAAVRTETGKGASRRARREGQIPAVLYGHGADPQHLLLPGHDFAAVLRHSGTNAVLTLDIDGKEQLALTKALDIHPIRRNIQHADLLVVRRGEKVTVEVNVVVEGEAAPGTLVTQETNTIEIESDVQSIPEQLTVSVEGADIGTQFTAGTDPAAGRRRRWCPTPRCWSSTSFPRRLPRTSRPRVPARSPRPGQRPRRPKRAPRSPPRAAARSTRRRIRVIGVSTRHGRATTGGGPGQSRAQLRQDPAQPRLRRRRSAGGPHGRDVQGAQEVRRGGRDGPARRPVGGAGQTAGLHERVGPPGRAAGEVLLGAAWPTSWLCTTNSTSSSAGSG